MSDSRNPDLSGRLERVVIEDRPASYIIDRYDGSGVLFYVDPPYPMGTRSSIRSERDHGRAYAFDMTDNEHRDLAAQLARCDAAVVISGYPCPLYDEELFRADAGWERKTKKAMADHGQERTEALWIKPMGVRLELPRVDQRTLL